MQCNRSASARRLHQPDERGAVLTGGVVKRGLGALQFRVHDGERGVKLDRLQQQCPSHGSVGEERLGHLLLRWRTRSASIARAARCADRAQAFELVQARFPVHPIHRRFGAAHHGLGVGHGDGEHAGSFELRQDFRKDVPPHLRHIALHDSELRVVVGVAKFRPHVFPRFFCSSCAGFASFQSFAAMPAVGTRSVMKLQALQVTKNGNRPVRFPIAGP